MNNLIFIAFEFVKVGLFAVGGGYSALPFLHDISVKYGWFSLSELNDFIVLSEITPGPLGINIATFTGYMAGGTWGGIIASCALVAVPLIIVLLLSKILSNPAENYFIKRIYAGLLPCTSALILGAAFGIFENVLTKFNDIFSFAIGCMLFSFLMVATFRWKWNTLLIILAGGIGGLFFFIFSKAVSLMI